MSDITKRDLVLVIDKILARGSTVMANRIRDLTAQVFNFAAMRDLIPSSPAAGLLKRPGGQEQAKERSLNRDEIRRSAASAAVSAFDTQACRADLRARPVASAEKQSCGREAVRMRAIYAATHMTTLGIQRLHVGKVLNHSEGGDITAVYDRYGYWDEKERALAAWEAELRSIIDGKPSKVMPIASKRIRAITERAVPKQHGLASVRIVARA